MEGVRFIVSGRVQGVGFRVWTRATALRLGILGTVRNLPDGSVRVDAAASLSALDDFRSLLREGPSSSRVTSVAEHPIAIPDTDTFEIFF